ncbi:MAG: peroxiredoxin [Pseudomonadales bacterium]
MLKIGDIAPEFELTDQQGEACSLSELTRAGPAVVYFYPADFTPGCTREACLFRDRYDALVELSVPVVGISPQSEDSHRRFADAFSLPFPLLSDPDKKVIRAFGVDGPLGFGVRRVTFLIGPDRRVENRVVADFMVDSHLSLVQRVIDSRPSKENPR